MSDTAPRIALIHVLDEPVAPIRQAFAHSWPQAPTADLLDASLSMDLATEGRLGDAMIQRFITLGRYAVSGTGVPCHPREPIESFVCLDDATVVRDTINQRSGHLGVSGNIYPSIDREIGGPDDTRTVWRLGFKRRTLCMFRQSPQTIMEDR